jgi:hypothetical protein
LCRNGVSSREAHVFSTKLINAFCCSADQRSSSGKPHSQTTAHTRHCEVVSDSQDAFASPRASAASIRYFKKTPTATSYAQKPLRLYVTDCVWLTWRLSSALRRLLAVYFVRVGSR